MTLTIDSIPFPAGGVTGRVLEPDAEGAREAVLVLPEKSQVKVLNDVGARIWSLVDGRRSLAEIARVICSEYAVDEAQAREDVLAFAGQLLRSGVLFLEPDHPEGS